MKYLKQFTIILGACLLGELLRYLLPLPIPASVYGMTLMFLALLTGVIKLHQVENAADFLVQIMPVMFVPSTVGLMDRFDSLRAILLPFLVINFVSLVFTFVVTGRVTELLLKKGGKKQ